MLIKLEEKNIRLQVATKNIAKLHVGMTWPRINFGRNNAHGWYFCWRMALPWGLLLPSFNKYSKQIRYCESPKNYLWWHCQLRQISICTVVLICGWDLPMSKQVHLYRNSYLETHFPWHQIHGLQLWLCILIFHT
jgi:hypothetical protein